MDKLEKVSYLLKEVASGEVLKEEDREWIKDNVLEDILGVFIHLGMEYNYDEMTAKWINMPTNGDFDKEAYEDLLVLALNYYEELEDDYYEVVKG